MPYMPQWGNCVGAVYTRLCLLIWSHVLPHFTVLSHILLLTSSDLSFEHQKHHNHSWWIASAPLDGWIPAFMIWLMPPQYKDAYMTHRHPLLASFALRILAKCDAEQLTVGLQFGTWISLYVVWRHSSMCSGISVWSHSWLWAENPCYTLLKAMWSG